MMKFTLRRSGEIIDFKDLTDAEKISFANELIKTTKVNHTFKNDKERITMTNCFFAGANPHAFFSGKKKLLPERVYNACNAADDFSLLKPKN